MRYILGRTSTFAGAGPLAPAKPRPVADVMRDQEARLHRFHLVLQNLDCAVSVGNVTAVIGTVDPRVSLLTTSAGSGDSLFPGAIDTSGNNFIMRCVLGFNPDSLTANRITFSMVIYSND